MINEMNESEQKTYELQPNKLVDGEYRATYTTLYNQPLLVSHFGSSFDFGSPRAPSHPITSS